MPGFSNFDKESKNNMKSLIYMIKAFEAKARKLRNLFGLISYKFY